MIVKCKESGHEYNVSGRLFIMNLTTDERIPYETTKGRRLYRFSKGDSSLNHRFQKVEVDGNSPNDQSASQDAGGS